MPKERIYRHPTQRHVDLPNLDFLTLLFDSEYGVAERDTVLHIEAANPDNKLTKSQLVDLIERICHSLRHNYALSSVGPKKDVVTVISYGQILVPAVLYGVIAAGAVYSAASPSSTVAELSRQVEIGQSRVIICGVEHRDLAAEVASENRLSWPRITDREVLRDSLIVILWSSGTTGLPKGVKVSHLNLVAETYITSLSSRAWADQEKEKGTYVAKQGSTLAHVPISHIAGLFGYLIAPVYNGAYVYPITGFYTVPSIWLLITKAAEISDHLKWLEGATTGAAPMDGQLMKYINRKVGDGAQKLIGQTWGLSETTGAATAMPNGEEGDDTGCIGRILLGVELRLVDDDYNDVDPDEQEGELIVRSPLVTKGHYNNPQATKEAFRGEWFCSGDIAMRKNGKIYIVDRKKELSKYKGLQVAPAEIQNLLISHPAIREAAVVGLPAPDEPRTDLPRAYVVCVEGERVNADGVKKFVAEKLGPYKQLRGGVVFVDEIPKNAIGKFLRRELRAGEDGGCE